MCRIYRIYVYACYFLLDIKVSMFVSMLVLLTIGNVYNYNII